MDLDLLLFDDDNKELLEFLNYQSRPYFLQFRIDHSNKWDDRDFKIKFRLFKEMVMEVLNVLQQSISTDSERYIQCMASTNVHETIN